MRLLVPFVCVFPLLTACATVSPRYGAWLSTAVDFATIIPPETLRRDADNGDSQAQLAYSIMLQYGLQHIASNPSLADEYRREALKERGLVTGAVWSSGAAKTSSHTQIVSTTRDQISEEQVEVAEGCARALSEGAEGAEILGMPACGSADNFVRLQSLWRRATD